MVSILTVILIVGALFSGYVFSGGLLPKAPNYYYQPQNSISTSPTTSPSVNAKPTTNTKTADSQNVNDPLIDCTSPKTGKTTKVKQSECDILVDCQLDGKWYVYQEAECIKKQKDYWDSYYANQPQPSYYSGSNYYYPSSYTYSNFSDFPDMDKYHADIQNILDSVPETNYQKYVDEFNESTTIKIWPTPAPNCLPPGKYGDGVVVEGKFEVCK